ncbi:MAG: polysaccharide biosynthesis/export family protein [Pyrinomonadaceae bacterium]
MKATTFFRTFSLTVLVISFAAMNGLGQTTAAAQKDSLNPSDRAGGAGKAAPSIAPKAGVATPDNGWDEADGADDILPYYRNYLKEYRLGPSDMISVEVFGQCPEYCVMGKTVPPNARISYPLIREGILVAGKTVEQVAEEITRKLDEYIIEPKVTVTLDKAMNTRYSVMGNVAAPGVRVMDRKVSVYEAIIESGGVTKNGDKNKVYVVSYTKDGKLARKTVSLSQMENGKADMVYLNPGDQVLVAGKGFTIEKVFDVLGKASAARLLFGSPF